MSLINDKNIYFSLMEKVDTIGPYQYLMLFNSCVQWYLCGMIIYSQAFLFKYYPKNLNSSQSVGPQSVFEQYQSSNITSTQYQAYDTDTIYKVSLWMIAVGQFVFSILFSIIADNYGRKLSWLISQGVALIGFVMILVGLDLISVYVGIVLASGGIYQSNIISMVMFAEQVDADHRQKFQLIVQAFYCISGYVIAGTIQFIPNRQTVMSIFLVTPCAISLLLLHWTQQTPKFILKRKETKQAIAAFGRIAKMNGYKTNPMTEFDIQTAKERQIAIMESGIRTNVTILDFFRYKSLMKPVFWSGITLASIFFVYLMGETFLFDIFDSKISTYNIEIIVTSIELLTYLPLFFYIEQTPRRLFGLVCLSCTALLGFILIFLPMTDQYFWPRMILLCTMRFVIAAYFNVFLIYLVELFPEAARCLSYTLSNAIGVCSIFALNNFTIWNHQLNGSKYEFQMVVVTVICLMGIVGAFCLKETYKSKLQQEIEQLNKIEKFYSSSFRD